MKIQTYTAIPKTYSKPSQGSRWFKETGEVTSLNLQPKYVGKVIRRKAVQS